MSLALVQVSVPVFHEIRDHLESHYPRHRNMHLREACYRNKKRVLHYLHALYAPVDKPHVEGMISGPDVFWHYRMFMASRTQIHLQVLSPRSTPYEDDRIYRCFLPEVLTRIHEEKTGPKRFPKPLPGQFYLRRSLPGMPMDHRHCRLAVSTRTLDQPFVSQLASWNLRLLYGPPAVPVSRE
jgi:hypothetical protein